MDIVNKCIYQNDIGIASPIPRLLAGTEIGFGLPDSTTVALKIYDAIGRERWQLFHPRDSLPAYIHAFGTHPGCRAAFISIVFEQVHLMKRKNS